ncbi:hypothetical protein BDQ17DRAFT_1364898 [Cyathus striatus]|nr:hypothetical protein BDQ17DRAFT_1364898 [Cyathus striatus]
MNIVYVNEDGDDDSDDDSDDDDDDDEGDDDSDGSEDARRSLSTYTTPTTSEYVNIIQVNEDDDDDDSDNQKTTMRVTTIPTGRKMLEDSCSNTAVDDCTYISQNSNNATFSDGGLLARLIIVHHRTTLVSLQQIILAVAAQNPGGLTQGIADIGYVPGWLAVKLVPALLVAVIPLIQLLGIQMC